MLQKKNVRAFLANPILGNKDLGVLCCALVVGWGHDRIIVEAPQPGNSLPSMSLTKWELKLFNVFYHYLQ